MSSVCGAKGLIRPARASCVNHKKNLAIIAGVSIGVWLIGSMLTYPPLARLAGLTVFVLSVGVYSLWATESE